MTDELEKKLIEKYPKMFVISESDITKPYPMFGIECGDGWYNLLDELCNSIQFHIDHNMYNVEKESAQVVVEQIKEKFGGLRFYFRGGDDFIDGLVSFAESMSYKTCEFCGTNQYVTKNTSGWIQSLCVDCRNNKDKN
jgi:hypothetical protein